MGLWPLSCGSMKEHRKKMVTHFSLYSNQFSVYLGWMRKFFCSTYTPNSLDMQTYPTKSCLSAPQTPCGSDVELRCSLVCSVHSMWSHPLLFSSIHPFHSFTVTICGARRRPLVSLGCFPGSRGCAWWWPWRLGTAGWCGLWAGWHSWTAPSRPGGRRPFVGRRWCCQNESRMKSAGSWCLGDHWMRRCEEGCWVGKK